MPESRDSIHPLLYSEAPWVDQTVNRVRLHLEQGQFEVARNVIRDIELARLKPELVDKLDLPMVELVEVRICNKLEEWHDVFYVRDILPLSGFEIEQTRDLGEVSRKKITDALAEIGVEWPEVVEQ